MKKLFLLAPLFFGMVFCGRFDKKQHTAPGKDSISKERAHSVRKKLPKVQSPFYWENANIYFLLTDRFKNGDPKNDINFGRSQETAPMRGFQGGDLAGITQKIASGYFDQLGVNAIWFTPITEQIHGLVDEGSGPTYGYHGYWTKDWTAIDPNFGDWEALKTLVDTAHEHGIRVIMDVVLNHTGPVTPNDPLWPSDWVRTGPQCTYDNYKNTTACTLVTNLPDVYTESDTAVELPDAILAKWKEEGRLAKELDELERFFERTGYSRAPRFYIIKWLTDYVHELGIDGFRVDTTKHVDEQCWAELKQEASYAFETWKKKHPEKALDHTPFFMLGEVYGYNINNGRPYDFGDRKVDYFNYGFSSLLNFGLKYDAEKGYESVFKSYDKLLHGKLKGKSVVNYLTSHDDGEPFDLKREHPKKTAEMLLLAPGISQTYYGDETARPLILEGTKGDATLRGPMNWGAIDSSATTQSVLDHWRKLGQFKRDHPAVGMGRHKKLSSIPYVFGRSLVRKDLKDKVAVGLDLPKGQKSLRVKGFFGNGTKLCDNYSGSSMVVENGYVSFDSPYDTALLELEE